MSDISRLKAKLKRKYLSFRDELDKYDCGEQLAIHLNPKLAKLSKEVDDLWKQCVALEASKKINKI